MSAIKPGDLVMVVKPRSCCGKTDALGMMFVVRALGVRVTHGCPFCFRREAGAVAYRQDGRFGLLSRLKKIDPPETGDSLPTRADLNLPEPACP